MSRNYNISDNCLTIYDSYSVHKNNIYDILKSFYRLYPSNNVLSNRSMYSLWCEWVVHNFLYNIKIQPHRTSNVDFEYPIKWYYEVLYNILGPIFWLFIK